jgi:outer membrane protein, multidrug efflux system
MPVSFADTPWWAVFQEPTLKPLIQEALRNKHDVRLAAARVQEARANRGVARADYFPSLNHGATAGRNRLPLGGLNLSAGADHTTDDFFTGYMTMSCELDICGRVRPSNEAARATLLANENARRGSG